MSEMPWTAVSLLLLFGGLAIVIALLSLLLSAIDSLAPPRNASNADASSSPTQEQQRHRHPVAAAIQTYQETRESDERHRAERETITIRVLTATGGFALLAAIATGYSALIFTQQAADFRDQEQRQLRAYVFPNSVTIINANSDITKTETDQPTADISYRNTGVTPAYNISAFGGAALLPFPNDINIKSMPLSIASLPSVAILPHDGINHLKVFVKNAEQPLTVDQKVSLNNGVSAIYFMGEIVYNDTFGVLRCTRFKYFVGGNGGFNGTDMVNAPDGNEADKTCRDAAEIKKTAPAELVLPLIPHYQF